MGSAGLGARLLLALVFAVAAAGKLADRQGTREALDNFRVPERLVAPLAIVLPLLELATAAALLVQPSARFGAVMALALLGAFAAAIAAAMVRGEAPDCHCFGQLHSAPAGPGTLARNALLAVPAVFVAIYGAGRPVEDWLPARSATAVIALVVVVGAVALAAFGLQLELKNRRLRRELMRVRGAARAFPPGLPVGTPAPRFSVRDIDGNTVTLESLLSAGRPIALVFISPDCGPCESMFSPLAEWQRRLAHRMTIVLPSRSSARQLRSLAEARGLRNLLVDSDSDVWDSYRASATPSAVIVNADGRIDSPTLSTGVIVEVLIRRALNTQNGRAELHDDRIAAVQWLGEPAPT